MKIVLLAPALLLTALALTPQQQVQTQRFQQFENDSVKVWRTVVAPNAPLAMHRHEHGRVIVPIVGGTMKIVTQGGGTETHGGMAVTPTGSLPVRPTSFMQTSTPAPSPLK